jgi:hypothetical protein
VQTSVNLCTKCSKTHIRASLVQKIFLGSLSLAIRGEGRTGEGQGRGGEGNGTERNGTERNGTERNGTERNGTERNGTERKISSYFRQ